MINPNELRIGNHILTSKEDVVVGVMLDMVETINYAELLYDGIEPIPITPEWLERFGFILENGHSFSEYFNKSFGDVRAYVIDGVWFCSHFDWMTHRSDIISERGWLVGRRNTNPRHNGWNYNESAEVRYIHELQNVFWCITGFELEIKEKP